MKGHEHLVTLFVLVLLTVLAPALAVRVRLPAPVVLILSGIGCGPAGLGWLSNTSEVALLSEIGFLVLMFLAGMEIDFEALRSAGARMLVVPSLSVAGCFGVAVGLGVARGLSPIEIIVVSASSVGMPLAVLQDSGQLHRPVGKHVMLAASIGEFASILAITGYELLVEQATLRHRAERVGKVLLLFVVSALLIRWARAAVWWRPEPFRRLIHHHDVAELGVRTGLLVLFGFVLISAFFGVEAILGAFIAGALVGFVLREKHTLESKLAALGHGLFIPIFFVVVGVRFDPRVLDLPAVYDAGVLVAIVAAVKLLPTLVFAPRALGFRERFAAGALLSAPLTLVVAIAAIGGRLGTVDSRGQAAFVLVALALSLGFPVVFRAVVPPATADKS